METDASMLELNVFSNHHHNGDRPDPAVSGNHGKPKDFCGENRPADWVLL